MSPSISIILPTYNGERYLREQLDSLLRQSWTDFELVAVDDGSSDGTVAILQDYARRDPRVRLLESSGNRGQKKRLVELLGQSRGEWIAISDQDDIWAPEKLQKLIEAAGGASLAFGRSELIDADGQLLNRSLLDTLRSPRRADDRVLLLFRPQVSGHAMLARRAIMQEAAFCSDEPFDWLISLLAEFSDGIVYCDDAVVYHRLHDANSHNVDIQAMLNPFLLRPRHLRMWLARGDRTRSRMLAGLEFLAAFRLVRGPESATIETMARQCHQAWTGRLGVPRTVELRRNLLDGLRSLARSKADFVRAAHYIDLATLGPAHPLTLFRAHKLYR